MGKITGHFKRLKHALKKITAKTLKAAGAAAKGYGYLKDAVGYFQPIGKAGATALTHSAPTLGKIAGIGAKGLGSLLGYGDIGNSIGNALESGIKDANELYKIELEAKQQDYYNQGDWLKLGGDFLWEAGNFFEPESFDIIFTNSKSELINDKKVNWKYQYTQLYSKNHDDTVRIQYLEDDIWKCKTKIKDSDTHVYIPSFDSKVKIVFNFETTGYEPQIHESQESCSIGYIDQRSGRHKMIVFPKRTYRTFYVDDGFNFEFN